MWYGFHVGTSPLARIRFRTLLCNPMSVLGGYSLRKRIAALNTNATRKIKQTIRVVLSLVSITIRVESNYKLTSGVDLLLSQT
jgi:hypothetical protein